MLPATATRLAVARQSLPKRALRPDAICVMRSGRRLQNEIFNDRRGTLQRWALICLRHDRRHWRSERESGGKRRQHSPWRLGSPVRHRQIRKPRDPAAKRCIRNVKKSPRQSYPSAMPRCTALLSLHKSRAKRGRPIRTRQTGTQKGS